MDVVITVIGDMPLMPAELVPWRVRLDNLARGCETAEAFIAAAMAATPPTPGQTPSQRLTQLSRIAARAVVAFNAAFDDAWKAVGGWATDEMRRWFGPEHAVWLDIDEQATAVRVLTAHTEHAAIMAEYGAGQPGFRWSSLAADLAARGVSAVAADIGAVNGLPYEAVGDAGDVGA